LAKLERKLAHEARQAHRLAFAAYVGDHPTHQYYYDRFAKLTRAAAPDVALLELASTVRDGNRTEAHNYLTHGIHSYKGKYFPQIVRSLVNAAGTGPGSLIVDPFVGSGTTTLEGALMGIRGIGLDRNPLAVLIARAKIDALRLTIDDVRDGESAIIAQLDDDARVELPNPEYLQRWFPSETLAAIAQILGAIEAATAKEAFKDLARLAVSTHLRSWSLQEPSQLRIFRRNEAPPASALMDRFVLQLAEYANAVAVGVRLLEELGIRLPEVRLDLADSRGMDAWGCEPTSVDAVITSPPYATALPYIDTDRLSIFCLGLAEVCDRSGLEWEMIGTREILTRQRKGLEDALAHNAANLPTVVVRQIRAIKSSNDRAEVGFRRRNLPALLYRYFIDMRSVLQNAETALRSGGLCAVVVGDSYTVAGSKKVRIRTADFLTNIAEEAGLHSTERIPMGGQTAYLPHQRNGIPAEEILLFVKP
jgi:site-specific DNA-methyltransferase (cytosine-N4-specific)